MERLLPGAGDLLLPNPARRFPLACGAEPERLGLRVPALEGELEPLAAAALAGAPVEREPRPAAPTRAASRTWTPSIRAGVDLVLDGGELPGTPSTVRRPHARTRRRRARCSRGCRADEASRCRVDAVVACLQMSELSPDYFTKPVAEVDPEIAEVLKDEAARQERRSR